MTYSYYFNSTESPTQYNLANILNKLGYRLALPTEAANFSDLNLSLDEHYCQQLEFKHLLARLLTQSDILPPTYEINESNYPQVLAKLKQQKQTGWILKPALLNNGEGIKLFHKIAEVERHYASTQRYGGEHVLQRYIIRPHLLNGHKYTFRLFVVITHTGAAYLYPQGYFNVCRSPYQPNDFTLLNSHLTNEHLNLNNGPNNWQIPTSRCPNFDVIFAKLKQVIHEVMQTLNANFSQNINHPAISLFGFDFMLDANLKAWLLEVNHGPCFPKNDQHPLQTHLYHNFWQHLVSEFVQPIAANQSDSIDFTPKEFELI